MFGKKKKDQQIAPIEEQELIQDQELEQPTLDELVEETRIFFESEIVEDDDVDYTQEFEAIAYILREEQGDILKAESLDPMPIPEEEFLESELIEDEDEEVVLEEIAEEPTEEFVEEIVEDAPVVSEDSSNEPIEEVQEESPQEVQEEVSEEPAPQDDVEKQAEPTPQEPQQEEVVYVVDGPEEEDEVVKPARLVRLPNLIDYMLTQNMSKRMKLNVATLLLSAYQKFKDIPEEKKIIIKCMAKVIQSLMVNQ